MIEFRGMENLYKILEVDSGASREVIKKAYRVLAEKYHPDRVGSSKQSESKMRQINHAYSVLSDPEKRRDYDMSFGKLPGFASINTPSGKESLLAILIDIIIVVAIAKLLVRAFPPLLLLFIPGTVFFLFVKYPKAFARIYVKSVGANKKSDNA